MCTEFAVCKLVDYVGGEEWACKTAPLFGLFDSVWREATVRAGLRIKLMHHFIVEYRIY